MTLTNLAVGVDASRTATDALAWAVGAAASSGATVRAVHVWTTPIVSTYRGTAPSTEELIRGANATVASALASTDSAGNVDSLIVHGSPGPALTAEARDADLLVVGRSDRLADVPSAFGEVLVGSTARYCVNHAAVPVAVIPRSAVWVDSPQVVVGIDGSPGSFASLRWAATSLPADATIHAVHAMIYPGQAGEIPMDYELLDPIVATNEAQLTQLVATHTCGVDREIRSHVIIGSALDILIDPGFAFDLIVLGEHGETAADAGVLGSVAEHTVRHAPVPLIVVPTQPPSTQT